MALPIPLLSYDFSWATSSVVVGWPSCEPMWSWNSQPYQGWVSQCCFLSFQRIHRKSPSGIIIQIKKKTLLLFIVQKRTLPISNIRNFSEVMKLLNSTWKNNFPCLHLFLIQSLFDHPTDNNLSLLIYILRHLLFFFFFLSSKIFFPEKFFGNFFLQSYFENQRQEEIINLGSTNLWRHSKKNVQKYKILIIPVKQVYIYGPSLYKHTYNKITYTK